MFPVRCDDLFAKVSFHASVGMGANALQEPGTGRDEDGALRAAEGLLAGVLLAVPAWLAVALAVWIVARLG